MSDLRDVSSALIDSAKGAGLTLDARQIGQRDWASALFVGIRLTIELTAQEDEAFDAWLIALPELDLPLRGCFVASAELTERSAGRATVELLVVEG